MFSFNDDRNSIQEMFLNLFHSKVAQLETPKFPFSSSKVEESERCTETGYSALRRERRANGSPLCGSDDSFDAEDEPMPTIKDFDLDWVFDVVLPLLNKGEVDESIAFLLVEAAYSTFKQENVLLDLKFEAGIETVVVGDIHGQFKDLLLIFEKYGRPGPTRRYIFNGDIVDRGPRSVACWLLICALKSVAPEYLFVTRGNHETRTVNTISSSFALECARYYNEIFFMKCQRAFDEIPLAYTLNSSIFITHGGLPRDLCLNQLRKMPKLSLNFVFGREIFMALLWNDPSNNMGYGRNQRGPSVHTFGPDITEAFLKKHNLKMIIRSHEYKPFGHEYTHQSKCLTIFSSPDYQNLGNTGAVALVDSEGNVKVEQFY